MKNFKNLSYFLVALFLGLSTTFVSCDDDKDSVDNGGKDKLPEATMTIADFKAKTTGDAVEITDEIVLRGTVISNQKESDNFYQSLYVQEGTASIKITCEKESGYENYPIGSQVAIKAKGLWLAKYYDAFTIGSADSGDKYKVTRMPQDILAKSVLLGDKGTEIVPKEIDDMSTLDKAMFGQLVKINNIQVTEEDKTKKLGEAPSDKQYGEITFTDKDNNTIVLSSNKFASFKEEAVPTGAGSITGILSTYGSTFQIMIRTKEDLALTGERFEVKDNFPHTPKTVDALNETFNDVTLYERVDLAGWYTESVEGNTYFEGKQYSSNNYMQIDGADKNTESWIVTPKLNLDAASSFKNLSFKSKRGKSTNEVLEVYISTDFDYTKGVGAANWEKQTVTLAPAVPDGYGNDFTASNVLDLSAKSGAIYVAFKYTCDGTKDGGIYQIDDVKFNFDPNAAPVQPTGPSLGFEDWTNGLPNGWAKGSKGTLSDIFKATDEKAEGSASLGFTGKFYISHMFALDLNTKYKISFKYKSAGTSPSVKLYSFFQKDSESKEYDKAVADKLRNIAVPASSDWKTHEVTFNSSTFNKFNFDFRVYTTGSGDDDKVYLDDVKLEKVN